MMASSIYSSSRSLISLRFAWLPPLLQMLSDSLALIVSASITFEFFRRFGVDANLLFDPYRRMTPAVFLFPLAYALSGLYPGFGLGAVEEFRRLSKTTFLIYGLLATSTFFFRGGESFSKGIFVMLLLFSLLFVPLFRSLLRELFASKSWWGAPVLILGAGLTGEMLISKLLKLPGLGLKPIAVLDDDISKHQASVAGLFIEGALSQAPEWAERGVRWALVAMPGLKRERLLDVVFQDLRRFQNVVIIPDAFGLPSLWVAARDVAGSLGLELRQSLVIPSRRLVKRLLDLFLTLLVTLIAVPILVIIWIIIRLDSPGAAVFTQDRPGQYGKRFKIFKFRTMYVDAEARFNNMDEAFKAEFEQFGKVKNDPRVTRVGAILRKTSLDELPQLLNVFRGEMSLVGPRAYLVSQVPQMGSYADTISQVLPGVTGLWQVSGRSEVSFEERLELDTYYVRNWSPWLDLVILARTAWVVLFARGAY
jgi:Undecaprenyl-phosphate galactose phosphotransferase WbaP